MSSVGATSRVGRPPSCVCGTCRRCKHAAYMRRWYQRKTRAERRAWVARRDPQRVALHNDNKMKARRADPGDRGIRQKARDMLNNALRDGKVQREPCSCGSPHTEAHHTDYNRPLDVQWLCRPCHQGEHA